MPALLPLLLLLLLPMPLLPLLQQNRWVTQPAHHLCYILVPIPNSFQTGKGGKGANNKNAAGAAANASTVASPAAANATATTAAAKKVSPSTRPLLYIGPNSQFFPDR
jgi:hypothetical protein